MFCNIKVMNQYLDEDRGLGKKVLICAGVSALAVGTAIVVGGIAYNTNKNRKTKKVKINGKSRNINCDIFVDDNGIELAGQEFNEYGVCINEQEVISRAVAEGKIIQQQNYNQNYPGHDDSQKNFYQPLEYTPIPAQENYNGDIQIAYNSIPEYNQIYQLNGYQTIVQPGIQIEYNQPIHQNNYHYVPQNNYHNYYQFNQPIPPYNQQVLQNNYQSPQYNQYYYNQHN